MLVEKKKRNELKNIFFLNFFFFFTFFLFFFDLIFLFFFLFQIKINLHEISRSFIHLERKGTYDFKES